MFSEPEVRQNIVVGIRLWVQAAHPMATRNERQGWGRRGMKVGVEKS